MRTWSSLWVLAMGCAAAACSATNDARDVGSGEFASESLGEAAAELSSSVHVVDVTSISGRAAVGPFASWQFRRNGINTELVAGRSPEGNALAFSWSPQHDWQAEDITA